MPRLSARNDSEAWIEILKSWSKTYGAISDTRRALLACYPYVNLDTDGIYFRFRSIRFSSELPLSSAIAIPEGHPGWQAIRLLFAFYENPSIDLFVAIIRQIVDFKIDIDAIPTSLFPWPVSSCLKDRSTHSGLSSLIPLIQSGQLGTPGDWAVAENRWINGIPTEDLFVEIPKPLPFAREIGKQGFPTKHLLSISYMPYPDALVDFLLHVAERASDAFLWPLLWFLSRSSIGVLFTNETRFRRLNSIILKAAANDAVPNMSDMLTEINPKALDALSLAAYVDLSDSVGRSQPLLPLHDEPYQADAISTWHRAFLDDPNKVGLLQLLASALSSGHPIEQLPDALLSPDLYLTDDSRFHASLLRLFQFASSTSEPQRLHLLAADLLARTVSTRNCTILFEAIERNLARMPALFGLLPYLYQWSQEQLWRSRLCDRVLRHALQLQTSGLNDSVRCATLHITSLSSIL